MTAEEALERLLKSFRQYYDIRTEGVCAPFCAEAEFHSCEEGFFLVKRAVISEAESNEYVFFYAAQAVDAEDVLRLDEAAWEEGQRRITPHRDHRNSDVSLVILAEHITEDAHRAVRKLKHYKSYRHTLHGFTHFRAVAFDTASGALSCNRMGAEKKKLFSAMAKELQG